MKTNFFYGSLGCLLCFCWTGIVSAQSTFDLEPPVEVSKAQLTLSPDPDALTRFRFATAEINEFGKITVATKMATQTLMSPMPGTVKSELDPRGIRVTEKKEKEYTVYRKFIEKDKDGNEVEVNKPEKKTRTVSVTRYRERTAEEQAEFAKRVAEIEAMRESGEMPLLAVAKRVDQEYTINVSEKGVDKNGEEVTRRVAKHRTRNIVVYRGETETKESVKTQSFSIDTIECYGVDGSKLDEKTIKARLVERQPVILVSSTTGITPFFESLLNPEAIFIVVPQE